MFDFNLKNRKTLSKIHSFDFEYDHDYTLIGIHSTLEDYRLAFFLNKNLKLHLTRFKDDLDFTSSNCKFPLYVYEDEATFTTWSLIANKRIFTDDVISENNNLFQEETKTSFFIPEKKQIDYFIKISGNLELKEINDILTKINQTSNIITSYTLEPDDLKSKDHLIF